MNVRVYAFNISERKENERPNKQENRQKEKESGKSNNRGKYFFFISLKLLIKKKK